MGGNILIKQVLASGIIILLLGMSIVPSSIGLNLKELYLPSVSGNTLYVGGIGPNNYTKIQDAIDNASDLDSKVTIDLNEYGELCMSRAIGDEAPYWTNTAHVKGHSELVKKRKIPASMKSVLSVPIFDKSKTLIAILNVDSTLPLSQSYLNKEKYYKLITIYADIIGENWVYW